MLPTKRPSAPVTPSPAAKKPKIWQPSIQQEHDYAAKTTPLKGFDKEVSIIISKCTSLNALNKANAISESLKKWEKITSDKWVLETVKGAKIDVNNVKKVPLKDQNFSERFSQTVIPLIQKEINGLLKKSVITEVSGMELRYLSPIFLREKKDDNYRLIMNLKELNKFVPHYHF